MWPLRLPGADGRQDEWSRTGLVIAERARTSWVRIQPQMALGAYELIEPLAHYPIPPGPI